MRLKNRAPLWLCLIVVFGLLAASCGGDDDGGGSGGGGGAQSEGPTGGEFAVSICEPQFLQPGNTQETCGAQVMQSLFTPLVEFDPDTAEPYNVVAESIESEDQQNWTITLNDGWTFHDGTPVTASSYVDA